MFTTYGSFGGAFGPMSTVQGEEGETTAQLPAGYPAGYGYGAGYGAGAGALSGRTLSYFAKNVSYQEFVTLLSSFLNVEVIPSPLGFIQFELSPSQYEKVMRYFSEAEKRTEIVNVDIRLLRVDLRDEFKWGIDWNAFFSGFRVGEVTRVTAGISSTPFTVGEPKAVIGLVERGKTEPSAIIEALQTYGEVHTVDSWQYQMKTGTPIPFANYRLERYFTIGVSQSQATTEIIAEVNEDEVGFRGSLAVFKKGDGGYYVDGFIDISLITDYTEVQLPGGGIQRAPNIEGKGFRISTQLSSLNKMIIVGGFRTMGISSEDRGVPLLQKIPILGYLFKGKRDLKRNSEFVVLITLRPAEEKDATAVLPQEKEILENF